MRKNRLLLSLMFALTYGAVACGGADDGLNDSTESLRRGGASGDGGVRGSKKHERDGDADVDEAFDESGDGGKRHGGRVSHERGDGGSIRGACERGRRGSDEDDDRWGDEDRKGDEDRDGDEDGKGGLGGPRLDGGIKQGGKPGRDGGR